MKDILLREGTIKDEGEKNLLTNVHYFISLDIY